jgi:small neutral amino acid transporter SnatA (MarC family)
MKLLKLLFWENMKSKFSWRKALTALTGLSFSFACVGHQIANNFKELPMSYLTIMGGVFVFYFGKGLFEGKQIK